MDDRQWRLSLTQGDTEGLSCMGWELAGPTEFEEALRELRAAGVSYQVAENAAADERGVAAIARLRDPAGFNLELYFGQRAEHETVRLPPGVSGFKTRGLGMGHVLVNVPDAIAMRDFYVHRLGFRLTDFIRMGDGKSAQFVRCTRRHHSLGAMDLFPSVGINHFMLEMETLDDLGRAFDRARDAKVRIINDIGRHTNDRMVSFYGLTPSGFGFECGWGGLEVDEATWRATEFHGKGALWGHRGSMMDEIAGSRTA
jgi:2,3-dihydroxybiphenyl 1,2-dioxygenase